eukprot:582358-Amphidinium_carterae.1
MPLQVTLASGREVPVTTAPGALVSVLRQEVADHLELHGKSVAFSAEGGKILEDSDPVPDDALNYGAPFEKINDLGGGEFEVLPEPNGENRASIANALCLVGFSKGVEYFEVETLEGDGAFIGVTTKDGLAEEYNVKGLMYGGPGNLTSGSAGLRTRYGNGVKKGSIIGVTVDLREA